MRFWGNKKIRNSETLTEALERYMESDMELTRFTDELRNSFYEDEPPRDRVRMLIEEELNEDSSTENKTRYNTPYVDLQHLDYLTEVEFEIVLKQILSSLRGSAERSSEENIDIIWNIRRESIGILTEPKSLEQKVGEKPMKRLEEVKLDKESSYGALVVVSNSYFKESAIEYAEDVGIELYDRDELRKLLAQVKFSTVDLGKTLKMDY